MGWFRKKSQKQPGSLSGSEAENEWILYAPIAGEVIPQNEIQDKEFAAGALGPGVGIIPASGSIYAPAAGKLVVIFQQGHALGMETDNGIKLLIHIGTDSVAFNGIGFKKKAWEGDQVEKGKLLVEFDRNLLRQFDLNDTVILSVSNFKEYADVEVLVPYHQKTEPGQPLLRIVPKSSS